MRGFSTVQRIVRTAAVAAIAALLTASCAQHMYLSGTYSGAADVPRYTDDWFAAARAGRTDIVQLLVDAHFPLETKTAEGYTALILSVYDNRGARCERQPRRCARRDRAANGPRATQHVCSGRTTPGGRDTMSALAVPERVAWRSASGPCPFH
jgi:hypothetical protein